MKKIGAILILIMVVLGIGIGVWKNTAENIVSVEDDPVVEISFKDEKTEQIVRNIINIPSAALGEEVQRTFNDNVTAFGGKYTLSEEDGVYYIENVDSEEITTDDLMNESQLTINLLVYNDKQGQDLTVDDIRKSIEEGNVEKKEAIDGYGQWWMNEGLDYILEIEDIYYGDMSSDENLLYNIYDQKDFYDLTVEEFNNVYQVAKDQVK